MAHVLVVDDDLGTLETLSAILSLAGHVPLIARTAGAGLSIAMSRRPQVILVDLRLPDFSGLEFVAGVHEHYAEIPIILMTGFGTPAARSAAKHLGVADFVEKPIDECAILEMVQMHGTRSAAVETSRSTEVHGGTYATGRWTAVVIPVTDVNTDVPTIAEWARLTGHSRGTLKQWCANAGVGTSESLDFARSLRLVIRIGETRCDWFNELAIIDSRTLDKFLTRGGLNRDGHLPRLELFLRRQRFVRRQGLLRAIQVRCCSAG